MLAVGSSHDEAVSALRASYAAIPPGSPVRLAKTTSNLFRFRDATAGPGLDVSGFDHVLEVDPRTRTAVVQGMTTYEDFVAATLPHGLMPTVVPQLKTITLGGAVTGLGIESTSFRHGLPHEAVREMQILTGDGQIVTATRDNEHSDLFFGFPNSYGTLGYALKLTVDLLPVKPFVRLRHHRFTDARKAAEAITRIEGADFLDGTVFGPDEIYLTIGEFTDDAPYLSDYTGQKIFFRSVRERSVDFLTTHDYLWRWDTDWFWCSGAFGLHKPLVRRLWPASRKRSDVYRKLVAWDKRSHFTARRDRWTGKPPREDVIQDIEVPTENLPEFLEFFHREIRMSPIWLCPLQAHEKWPLYPLQPGRSYVNVGFWGTVPQQIGKLPDHHNRRIEKVVDSLDGHKSLYSTAFYSREEFWKHYDGTTYAALKERYDSDGRLYDLYDKCVRGT